MKIQGFPLLLYLLYHIAPGNSKGKAGEKQGGGSDEKIF